MTREQIVTWLALFWCVGLLAIGAMALGRINKRFRAAGIFEWHPHNGEMRRKKRDGSFEYRPATEREALDQVDLGAV